MIKIKGSIMETPSDLPSVEPKCPVCGKPSIFSFRPFCSKRCADIDLNRWLSGVYAIKTDEKPEIEEKN